MGNGTLGVWHLICPEEGIKSQDLTDFLEEFSFPVDDESPLELALYVDGSSNVKGSGARIVLEGPNNIFIEQMLSSSSLPTIIRQSTRLLLLAWFSP